MELHGLTQFQQDLADTLWDCETQGQVQAVINEYGNPAFTVYQLLIAAHYDAAVQTDQDVALAQQVIDDLCK
jgi:hypothetical protein